MVEQDKVKDVLELQDQYVLGKDWAVLSDLFKFQEGFSSVQLDRLKFVALLFYKRGLVNGSVLKGRE